MESPIPLNNIALCGLLTARGFYSWSFRDQRGSPRQSPAVRADAGHADMTSGAVREGDKPFSLRGMAVPSVRTSESPAPGSCRDRPTEIPEGPKYYAVPVRPSASRRTSSNVTREPTESSWVVLSTRRLFSCRSPRLRVRTAIDFPTALFPMARF